MHPHTDECTAAIAGFATAVDPTQLGVLPTTCTLKDLSAVLESLPDERTAALGSQPVTATVRHFRSARLPQIRAWLSGDRVMLLDAESPAVAAEAYLQALGRPEARLDFPWEHVTLKDAELVWPARGVVLVSSPHVRGVIRVGIFPPTSLVMYLLTRRLNASSDESTESAGP
jgi:hypothetical protein